MATNPEDLPTGVGKGTSASQRLFSEEVGIAAASEGQILDNKDVAYEFSNGRRFKRGQAPNTAYDS
jgi:hypothetical protein